jgi:Holliday junction resolvase RusA-like endonuclease
VTWTFEVTHRVPNANDRVVNRSSRNKAMKRAFAVMGAKYRKQRGEWTLLVRNAMQLKAVPKATQPRRVTIIRLYSGREREWDYGNLVGGCKPVLDAMKAAGLIVDDSPKWSEQIYKQERGAESGLRVEVTDL